MPPESKSIDPRFGKPLPPGSVPAPIAGNAGLWGLEYQYSDELNGVTGRSYGYYSSNSALERNVKDAQDGNSIVTTLDISIQSIVEKKIDKFMKKTGAKNVGCVVMNPKNGEIYAMSSDVRYDLNNAFDLTQMYPKKKVGSMTEEENWKVFQRKKNRNCSIKCGAIYVSAIVLNRDPLTNH